MEKKEIYSLNRLREAYRDLLESPWCPLFGQIRVPCDFDIPSFSPVHEIIDVIMQARSLWFATDSLPLLDIGADLPGCFSNRCWPEPEEIDNYPSDLIRVVRAIWMFAKNGGLYEHVGYHRYLDPLNGIDIRIYTSFFNLKASLVITKIRELLSEIYIDQNRGTYVVKNEVFIPIYDYALLGLLAIAEAWWSFNC